MEISARMSNDTKIPEHYEILKHSRLDYFKNQLWHSYKRTKIKKWVGTAFNRYYVLPLCRQTGTHPHAKSCGCEITLNLHFGSASPPCTSTAQSSWLDVPCAVATTLLLESYWRNVCQGKQSQGTMSTVKMLQLLFFNMLQPCNLRPVHLLGQCWQETGEYLHQSGRFRRAGDTKLTTQPTYREINNK